MLMLPFSMVYITPFVIKKSCQTLCLTGRNAQGATRYHPVFRLTWSRRLKAFNGADRDPLLPRGVDGPSYKGKCDLPLRIPLSAFAELSGRELWQRCLCQRFYGYYYTSSFGEKQEGTHFFVRFRAIFARVLPRFCPFLFFLGGFYFFGKLSLRLTTRLNVFSYLESLQ